MTYLCTYNAPSRETAQHMSSLFYFPIDFKDIQAAHLVYIAVWNEKKPPQLQVSYYCNSNEGVAWLLTCLN